MTAGQIGGKTGTLTLPNLPPQDVRLAVVGNKCDMESHAVEMKEAEAFCEENGMLFFLASAKTGENVQRCFSTLANTIYQEVLRGEGS